MLTVGKIYDGKFADRKSLFFDKEWVFIQECDDGISGEFLARNFEVVEEKN